LTHWSLISFSFILQVLETEAYSLDDRRPILSGEGVASGVFASASPRSMEHYGQSHGYILYRTDVFGPRKDRLILDEIKDIALIFLNGVYLGSYGRQGVTHFPNTNALEVDFPDNVQTLDIFSESFLSSSFHLPHIFSPFSFLFLFLFLFLFFGSLAD
jgi:hypothetical protein